MVPYLVQKTYFTVRLARSCALRLALYTGAFRYGTVLWYHMVQQGTRWILTVFLRRQEPIGQATGVPPYTLQPLATIP